VHDVGKEVEEVESDDREEKVSAKVSDAEADLDFLADRIDGGARLWLVRMSVV
jgi:hypothetical protein